MNSSEPRESYKTEAIRRVTALARKRGWQVQIEPDTEFCARIQRPGGRVHVVIGADLGLNRSAAKRLADDKSFAAYYLQSDGIKTIDAQVIGPNDGVENKMAFPLIVKPNRGFGGDGVVIVSERKHLETATAYARQFDSIVLAQPFVLQPEYRLLVAGDRCICVYERVPICIDGNGKSTWAALLAATREQASTTPIDPGSPHVAVNLKCQGVSLYETAAANHRIWPVGGANLKLGARSKDVERMDGAYQRIAVRATRALGLTVAGVDMFIPHPAQPDGEYVVIEVNANPGFEYLRQQPAKLERFVGAAFELIDRSTNG